MPPNPRVAKAFRAMKEFGISEDKVKPVLKNLLKLYEKNWEVIEAENYRLLVDSIFEAEELEAATIKEVASNVIEQDEEEAEEQDDLQRPLKRLRLKHQQGQSSQPHNDSSPQSQSWEFAIVPKDEPLDLPEVHVPLLLPSTEDSSEQFYGAMVAVTQPLNSEPPSPNNVMLEGGFLSSEPLSPTAFKRAEDDGPPSSGHVSRRGKEASREACMEDQLTGDGLTSPKRKTPTDDLSRYVVPLAVVHPETRIAGSSNISSPSREKYSLGQMASEPVDGAANGIGTGSKAVNMLSESSSKIPIASSPLGEVTLSLSCASSGRSDFHMPDIDTVLKFVEDKCLKSYKILDPNFSVKNLMKDVCECFLQLGSEKARTQPSPKTYPRDTILSVESNPPNMVNSFLSSQEDSEMVAELSLPVTSIDGTLLLQNVSDSNGSHLHTEPNGVDDANCKSLVVVQEHQLTPHSLHAVLDICLGHERVGIPVVNDVNNEPPPSFHYIPKNVFFHKAYVNFSLVRIGDNNCSHCISDCLSHSTPCECANGTGGDFAYTAEGLVKEKFLEECLSMIRDPEKQLQSFCKECPLEKSKNGDNADPCKGHLVKKFIKECWWKCGCNKQCGNRVVQRGINRNLQVFMTKEKGWGLRALEDLPKGAFVCEYVGEVLTNAEFFDRVSKSLNGKEHSYPVLLDADWGSEGVLKGKEALCLDGTYYGNIARFINHRCFDSTLVDIPVEIETPDHHYYHLAFFTSREVKAMEELTWDYGIDFDDVDHPVNAFHCECGSQFCRNMKRPKRSRQGF